MGSLDSLADPNQLVNQYLTLVSFVILYYDYALTLRMEIQRFWTKRPFAWVTVLFFVNRYLAVLGHFPVFFQVFWNERNLEHKFKLSPPSNLSPISIVLLIMRIYALYGRKRWIVWLFLAVAAIDIPTACWAIASMKPITLPPEAMGPAGCNEPLSHTQGVRLAVAWSGQLGFDAIVFFLTLWRSITIGRSNHQALITTLFRDGAFYFGVMTAANLANILTFVFAPATSKGVTSTFTSIISATIMSRLMFNLRDPKMLAPPSLRTRTTTPSDPMVSTFVDPYPTTTRIYDDEYILTEGDLNNPINDIELEPRNHKPDWTV